MRRWFIALLVLALLPIHAASAREICFPGDKSPYCFADPFSGYWESNGGLPVFGYPITAAGPEANRDTGQTYQTQWAERNRFELHPENAGTPYEILLGLLGKDRLAQIGRNWQAEPRESGPKAGCLWFEQTGHNVCDQAPGLGFKSYWQANGLNVPGLDGYARSLQLFGLPLTEPKMETNSSGDTVLTQWFERARFEWHPNNPNQFKVLLGLLGKEVRAGGGAPPPPSPTPPPASTWLDAVNRYRAAAGVPLVTMDSGLNENCLQHARYMAENNDLTHNQDPSLPWASSSGQICAEKGNAWIGMGGTWSQTAPVDSWMESPGHRLWLLYPTTPTFGYGFFRANNGTSAAALDVLSRARMGEDRNYSGWPVRYPGADQANIPARLARTITLTWPYFGSQPQVQASSVTIVGGATLPHGVSTALPANHKGIQLSVGQDIPAGATVEVSVRGTYDGQGFEYRWRFTVAR